MFIEENGYFCFCRGWANPDGTYMPFVTFERKRDHDLQLTHIPAMSHRIKANLPSEQEAIRVARDYAIQQARADDVGL